MNNQTAHHPSLDEVLDEIATAPTPPDAKRLRSWMESYPAYANAIVAFVTDWIDMEINRTDERPSEDAVDAAVSRTMSRVQSLLDEADRSSPLVDLDRDIRSAGHDFASFARTIRIDRSILDCLVARLIKPATIPRCLIQAVAVALNRSADQVREYLRLPPQISAAAFKARQQPVSRQANFGDLIRSSELNDVEKARWLAEPPDSALRE